MVSQVELPIKIFFKIRKIGRQQFCPDAFEISLSNEINFNMVSLSVTQETDNIFVILNGSSDKLLRFEGPQKKQ